MKSDVTLRVPIIEASSINRFFYFLYESLKQTGNPGNQIRVPKIRLGCTSPTQRFPCQSLQTINRADDEQKTSKTSRLITPRGKNTLEFR